METRTASLLYGTWRRRAVSRHSPQRLALTVLLGAVGIVGVLAVVLLATPWSTMPIPGARRAAALVNRVPLPWKPPRPVHVPLPDGLTQAQEVSLPAAVPLLAREAREADPAVPSAPAPESGRHPVLDAPLPSAFALQGIKHQWQTWNNCGPATIVMATSYFGRQDTQAQAAQFLKPNPDDKNVTPDELIAYLRSVGLRGDNLYAGDLDRLKRLVANGIPIVLSMWYTPSPNDGIGHYRLLSGYDEAARQFIFQDSYQAPGINVRIGYDAFDEDWRVYARAYLPVYSADQAEIVAAITAGDLDEAQLRQRSLAVAEEELVARPGDAYSWFNLGTALTRVGRTTDAVYAFDRARALRLPWRLLWYQFAPFEAYLAENRLSDVLALADVNIQQAPELEESQYFRGKALEGLGRRAEARVAFETALRVNPTYAPALHALSSLN